MAERPLHVRYTPAGAPGASRLVVLNVSPLTAIGQIKLELLVELGIDLPLQKLTVRAARPPPTPPPPHPPPRRTGAPSSSQTSARSTSSS